MRLSGILLCLLCCSTSSRRSKRDSRSQLNKAKNILYQTNLAFSAVKNYKDQSKAITDLVQVFIIYHDKPKICLLIHFNLFHFWSIFLQSKNLVMQHKPILRGQILSQMMWQKDRNSFRNSGDNTQNSLKSKWSHNKSFPASIWSSASFSVILVALQQCSPLL